MYFMSKAAQYNTDALKIQYALSMCQDDAAEWANPATRDLLAAVSAQPFNAALMPFNNSWTAFADTFLLFFGVQDKEVLALEKLSRLEQGNSRFPTYLTKFQMLVSQTGLSDTDKRARLEAGTHHETRLQVNLSNQPHNSFTTWATEAVRLDNILHSHRRRKGAGNPSSFTGPRTPPRDPDAMDVDATGVIKCYRCQGTGHMAGECRNPVKCRWCAGPHDSRQHPKDKPKQRVNATGDDESSTGTSTTANLAPGASGPP